MKMFMFVFVVAMAAMSFVKEESKPVKVTVVNPCGPNLDFTLTNKTGYDIEDIYVAPTKQQEWGDDIMGRDLLEDGESVDISFAADEKIKKWDIYVTWKGYKAEEDRYWIGFDLSTINEISLYYDDKTGKTWAITD